MSKMLLILFLCLPAIASACRVANTSTSERVNEADAVYFGYVTAIHLNSFETQKSKGDLFTEHEYIVGSDLKTYRLLIKETFKGKSQKIKEIKIQWCGGGQAELGSRVVVYKSKFGNYIEVLSEELYKNIKLGIS